MGRKQAAIWIGAFALMGPRLLEEPTRKVLDPDAPLAIDVVPTPKRDACRVNDFWATNVEELYSLIPRNQAPQPSLGDLPASEVDFRG